MLQIGDDDEQNDLKGKYAAKKSEIDQKKEEEKKSSDSAERCKMECVSNIYR